MQPIQPPDTHYFSAALGWLELGNLSEARLELKQIDAAYQHHADVLELRWAICAAEGNWSEALEVSRATLTHHPKRASGWLHQAYALRRAPGGSVQSAWEALLPAAGQFPEHPIFAYNLACYACQMGQLDTAREWLTKATQAGDKSQLKEMALKDEDLAPLWAEIQKW